MTRTSLSASKSARRKSAPWSANKTPTADVEHRRPRPIACAWDAHRRRDRGSAALAEECVRNAVVEAEQMAGVEIRSVYLGVTGGHLRGFNNRGVHPVVSADRRNFRRRCSRRDQKCERRLICHRKYSRSIAVRQHFFLVDGEIARYLSTNPFGMLGARLEVDMHVVHGNTRSPAKFRPAYQRLAA